MKNQDIRQEIKAAGLRLWQVADGLGISDNWFSRKLRHELPDSEKLKIRQVIAELTGEAI